MTTAAPRVVHCKREPYDVYVGRPSVWGNPFREGDAGTREEVIAMYRDWVLNCPSPAAMIVRKRLSELRGKTLGCWCAPRSCHADVLLELANG